eukprot:scpid32382/ scgid9751/ Puratrophin-1; Pleckstrin homology domain-containing family G member 4; Purkinje cell atrophy-associated protein 1
MADADSSSEEMSAATSAGDGSGDDWMNAALSWSILTMHYLSSTSGTDPLWERALENLNRHEEQHPKPRLPAASLAIESRDEADGLITETVSIVEAAVHNLRTRRQMLEERKETAASTTQEQEASSPSRPEREECISPDDMEEDQPSDDITEWLPFPSKRPSQMDLHGWISDLQTSFGSSIAGQFKRQRLESDEGAMSIEQQESVDQTDTAPDKGAYLVMMRKRQELADELISSEARYVEDLEAVLKNYYEGYDYGSLANVPGTLRGKKNIIFGNLKKILEFNKSSFSPALAAVQKTPLKIGQTFMDYERELGLYSIYFKNMPAQEDLLQENIQFFRSIQIRLNDPYTLQSYLIKPMQRMTKYKQFLESFVNYTPKTEKMEKFHEELSGALWLVRFQLRHGNDLLVLDRLKGFGGNPAEQGLLLRQGEFHVQNKKGRHERRVFLFEEMLLLAKKQKPAKGSREATYLFKEGYKVCDMGIVETVDNNPSKFELYFKKHNNRESVVLTPMDTEGRSATDIHDEWVADVQKLLWQQFKRVKERMENLRSGVEASMFGNKRASTIYGEVGTFGGTPPGSVSPMTSMRGESIVSGGSKDQRGSVQTAGSGGYAVPTGTLQRIGSVKKPAGGHDISGHDISGPIRQPPLAAAASPTAYAVSSPVIVGATGTVDPRSRPAPTVPPPPIPSAENSASSVVSMPPPPLPARNFPAAAAASDYLTPDEPKPINPVAPLPAPPVDSQGKDDHQYEEPPPRPPSPLAADYRSDEKPSPVQPITLPAEPEEPVKRLVSPTRAPPPPPPAMAAPASDTARPPLPAIPGDEGQGGEGQGDEGQGGDGEHIYDEVSGGEDDDGFDDDDEFDPPPADEDRQSVATEYETVDGPARKS